MEILVRGRFLGFRINPLMQLTESTLNASPLPELKPLLNCCGAWRETGKRRDKHWKSKNNLDSERCCRMWRSLRSM